MSEDDIQNTAAPAADDGKAGYKRPPAKHRFPKGKSGNPLGRRKGQRNLSTVLSDVLRQTVTVKQGDKSERVTKGEALIKVIMSKANNGDRRAIDALSYLAEKIGRIDDINSETSPRGGVMLVPGVLTPEEYEKEMAEYRRQKELVDQQRQADAPMLARKEAALRGIIARYKGSPEADAAAICLVELLRANQFNFYIKHQTEEELEKEQPLGCYRRPFNTAMWSSGRVGTPIPGGLSATPETPQR